MMAGGQIGPDPDAVAFLTAAGITDATITLAIDTLVKDLKSYGIWTKMKALYPFVGGTASTHKFNLKDPQDTNAAFRLVFSGGWTHSATGALPNGTNAFADTFIVPSFDLNLNDVHASGYVRNNLQANAPIFSAENASTFNDGLYCWPRISGTYSVRVNDNTSEAGASTDSRGYHIINRTASNVKKYFKNNILEFNATTASTNLNASSIYISKSRNNNQYGVWQTAFNSFGNGLTDTEAANYYTAVQAFQTTLGRQV